MTAATITPTAPIVRNDDLDEIMVEQVAALAHVTHRLATGQPITPGQLADGHFTCTTVQRYLGAYYPSGHSDALAEWSWTLDRAREAGIVSVQ